MPYQQNYLLSRHSDISTRLFDPVWLENNGQVVRSVKAGRGQVVFFSHNGQQLVLRQYRRGGLPAHLVRRSYLWWGVQRSRAWREHQLLEWMQRHGLPAPRPYAVHIERRGLVYTASIIVHRIMHAVTLSEALCSATPPSGQQFEDVGATIRHFHDCSIDHADLNANNILLDHEQDVWLIDFDRCRLREHRCAGFKNENLLRLKRSLDKLSTRSQRQFCHRGWEALLAGYHNG